MMHLKRCPVLATKAQLTVMGLGSESSLGQILQKGCPNSWVFVSFSAWQTLLVEPFLNFILLLTTFHLFSNEAKCINLFDLKSIFCEINASQQYRTCKTQSKRRKWWFCLISCCISFLCLWLNTANLTKSTPSSKTAIRKDVCRLSNSPAGCRSSWLFSCFDRTIFASPWQQYKGKEMWWCARKRNIRAHAKAEKEEGAVPFFFFFLIS